MEKLFDFFTLTKSNEVHENKKIIKYDVCSPGFIKNFFDFMFMKN